MKILVLAKDSNEFMEFVKTEIKNKRFGSYIYVANLNDIYGLKFIDNQGNKRYSIVRIGHWYDNKIYDEYFEKFLRNKFINQQFIPTDKDLGL